MDSGMMSKKKRLMAIRQNEKKEKKPEAGILGVADCDIGASPQKSKGSIFKKGLGGGGKESPIIHAHRFQLGKKNK